MTADPAPPTAGREHWRLHIGGRTAAGLLAELEQCDIGLNPMALELLQDPLFPTPAQPEEIELVAYSVAELGLPAGAVLAEIHAQARAMGLQPCPLVTAPHLRLAWATQAEAPSDAPALPHRAPPGSLKVVSPPLHDDEDRPCGFYLRRVDGRLWLRGYRSWSGHVWSPGDRMVFRLG